VGSSEGEYNAFTEIREFMEDEEARH